MAAPEYDVVEVVTASGRVIATHRTCLHANVVPVEAGGEVVAQLCTDCDRQLEAWWTP